jgi:hypothetical protein
MQATKPTWSLQKYKLIFYTNILAKGHMLYNLKYALIQIAGLQWGNKSNPFSAKPLHGVYGSLN